MLYEETLLKLWLELWRGVLFQCSQSLTSERGLQGIQRDGGNLFSKEIVIYEIHVVKYS